MFFWLTVYFCNGFCTTAALLAMSRLNSSDDRHLVTLTFDKEYCCAMKLTHSQVCPLAAFSGYGTNTLTSWHWPLNFWHWNDIAKYIMLCTNYYEIWTFYIISLSSCKTRYHRLTSRNKLTLWPWPLTFYIRLFVAYGVPRVPYLYQVWRSYDFHSRVMLHFLSVHYVRGLVTRTTRSENRHLHARPGIFHNIWT